MNFMVKGFHKFKIYKVLSRDLCMKTNPSDYRPHCISNLPSVDPLCKHVDQAHSTVLPTYIGIPNRATKQNMGKQCIIFTFNITKI